MDVQEGKEQDTNDHSLSGDHYPCTSMPTITPF